MQGALSDIAVFDAAAVRAAWSYDAGIPLMREAMIALSTGQVVQTLRSFIGLGEGRTFAIMPAALPDQGFGAKLVSVYARPGRPKTHEGLVVLFDTATGAPVCLADAGEVTALRTPAASAAATDALARPDADVLAVLGIGRQARGHVEAISKVRRLREVRVWGRDTPRAQAFAAEVARRTGLMVEARADAETAIRGASILCTTTAAIDPVLLGAWVAPGAHVNLVGSSGPAVAEADTALVARSRYFVDHRPHVLVHGGEYLRAKAAGAVGDDHILAEIGAVFAGAAPGRTAEDQVTVYKSLGHAVQDLAVAQWLLNMRFMKGH